MEHGQRHQVSASPSPFFFFQQTDLLAWNIMCQSYIYCIFIYCLVFYIILLYGNLLYYGVWFCLGRVASRALKGAPITAIAEGKNKHNDDILLASDRDGRLAVWNLSLFRMQCLDLPLELLTSGFHDPEDPGILSLAFHQKTACFLSGGTDGIIK